MSTRCNIEIYDKLYGHNDWHLGARLYHHADGYPSFMLPKLQAFIDKSMDVIKHSNYGACAERVAALMISLSTQDYSKPQRPNKIGMPYFHPCLELHGDIDYLYKVYLLPDGKCLITHEKL